MQDNQAIQTPMRPVSPAGIISAKLERLRALATTLGYSDHQFTSTLDEACALSTGLEAYITACTTPESDALAELVKGTRSTDWQDRFMEGATTLPLEQEMLSGHIEGQLLKILIHATGARRVLEIGMFTGYSALAMAEALPEDGKLIACEVDAFAANFAQGLFGKSPHGNKISVDVGHAIDTLDRLAVNEEAFDLVFIDADKGSYWAYLDKLLSGDLLAANALICVDNTLMQGQPYLPGQMTDNGRAIQDFNQRVASDARVEQVLLPVRDGLTLIRRV